MQDTRVLRSSVMLVYLRTYVGIVRAQVGSPDTAASPQSTTPSKKPRDSSVEDFFSGLVLSPRLNPSISPPLMYERLHGMTHQDDLNDPPPPPTPLLRRRNSLHLLVRSSCRRGVAGPCSCQSCGREPEQDSSMHGYWHVCWGTLPEIALPRKASRILDCRGNAACASASVPHGRGGLSASAGASKC